MDQIEIFQVDTFTDKVFYGNPAAVCLLDEWLNDELMQAIAVENNLSETAFVTKNRDGFQIRWFTPNGEINLCGHATLASGFVLFEQGICQEDSITFSSLSGQLAVNRNNDLYTLDFPRLNYFESSDSETIMELLNQSVAEIYDSELDYLVQFADEAQVAELKVDLEALAKLPKRGLIATSLSDNADFYSRCFYPKHNISEDPVTGSAHCVLTPFWSARLNKTCLIGKQGSIRQGTISCQLDNNRVYLSGHCRWYLKGHIVI